MFHNEGQLWVRILESKYGGGRGLDVATNDKKQSLWWRDLKSVFHTSQQGEELKRGIKWRIGCGDRIKFWEDEWIEGEAALGAKYPRLSLISCQQNQLIQHMGDYKEAGWEWKLAWRRPLFDNEVLMAANFLNDIERQPLQMHRRDGCDVSNKYTMDVRVNNLVNKADLIVYGCIFFRLIECLGQENDCREICA